MQVTVLCFGILREALGAEFVLELPVAATVEQILRQCAERTPELSAMWPRIAIAVNQAYCSRETVLQQGDEVALLPPVSGGGPIFV